MPLEKKIIDRIRRDGPMTFETFMEMALYDPDHGFYASDRPRIGREGDFYTSSHLHPVFGAIAAKQIMEMWTVMDKPERFTILEMGAGEGYLCNEHPFLASEAGECVAYVRERRAERQARFL